MLHQHYSYSDYSHNYNHHNNNKNNNHYSNIHTLGWADKFAGRGAGIEADNTVNGVTFNFYILPDNQLSIYVTDRTVTSSVRDLTVLSSYKCNIDENDGKMEKLVLKAVTNLISSLKIDLEGLFVPSVAVLEEHSSEHSLEHSLEGSDVLEVEKKEIQTAETVSASLSPAPSPPPPPSNFLRPPSLSSHRTSSYSAASSTVTPPLPSSPSIHLTPPTPPTPPTPLTPLTPPTASSPSPVSSSFNIPLESTRERSNPLSSSSSSASASKSKIDGNSDLNQVDLQSAYSALQSAAKSLTPPLSSSSSSSSSFKNDGKFIDVSDNMEVRKHMRKCVRKCMT